MGGAIGWEEALDWGGIGLKEELVGRRNWLGGGISWEEELDWGGISWGRRNWFEGGVSWEEELVGRMY